MNPVTDISQLDFNKSYTYADYLTWRFRERVELIWGKVFRMSPAPTSSHQFVVSVLHGTLFQYLKSKILPPFRGSGGLQQVRPCKVFTAPYDVILPLSPVVLNTIVQPDITVVCDPSKITEQGCEGVPDLVVEVVSSSSVMRDLHEKYAVYEQAGIAEYWVVHPHDRTLIIFSLQQGGSYQPSKPLTKGDIAASHILPGFKIDLDDLFADVVHEPEEQYAEIRRI